MNFTTAYLYAPSENVYGSTMMLPDDGILLSLNIYGFAIATVKVTMNLMSNELRKGARRLY